jgi:hypothetical protein
MNLRAITTVEGARSLAALPRIAVDLGFASKAKSCGLACHGTSIQNPCAVQFGEAVRRVAALISAHSELVLILEGPLSAAFDRRGNPCARGEFERTTPPRWWSLGSGATVALSALYFLRNLCSMTESSPSTVHLTEGFVVGDASIAHERVADALCHSFTAENTKWHTVRSEGTVHSIIDWFQPGTEAAPPAIIEPA